MQIDGYVEADPKIANEIGVEFHYKTKYGDIYIRAKSAGKANVGFRKAMEKLERKREVQRRTGFKPESGDDFKASLAVWHDHIIISWRTKIKSVGKPIEPTRENFVELLSDDLFIALFVQFAEDCKDSEHFTAQAEDAVKKK